MGVYEFLVEPDLEISDKANANPHSIMKKLLSIKLVLPGFFSRMLSPTFRLAESKGTEIWSQGRIPCS